VRECRSARLLCVPGEPSSLAGASPA
jgi:hypothetical protein